MALRHFILALAIAVLIAPGCGGVIDPSENRIEEFSGSVDPLGATRHEFSVSRNGEFEIRFLTLNPSDAILEVIFGQFLGGGCQPLNSSFGGQNQIVLTGAITRGDFCVLVFDQGIITQSVTYTLRVSYP